MLVVADQAPVQYQDPVGLLVPPPLRLRHEPLDLRVAFDDLDVDAQAGTVRDDLVLETLVDQGFADASAGVLGDLVKQNNARGVVVGVRSEDDDRDDQTEDVHGKTLLAAGHPLSRIVATRWRRGPRRPREHSGCPAPPGSGPLIAGPFPGPGSAGVHE